MTKPNTDSLQFDRPGSATLSPQNATGIAELTSLKRELLKAEVRLAKARATVVGAEVDIKVLSSRIKAIAR